MLSRTSRKRPDRTALAAALLLALTGPAQAFDMDSGAPISVKANKARLDDSAGRATYTGNVQIVQEETRLFADRVELYRDPQGLSRIQAFGDPARYEQAATAEAVATDAEAAEIEFESAESLLTFRQNAVIRQAGDVFRGDIIRYDTEARLVTAEKADSEGASQVEMIIYPRRGTNGDTDTQRRQNSGSGGGDGAAESQ